VWAHRAPYIQIKCVIGGIESELAKGQPIGDASRFKARGDTNAVLKWRLATLSNYTGTTGIQSAVATQMRAAAEQNSQSWSCGQNTRISLRKSDGKNATILDFAHPERWVSLKVASNDVVWDNSVVLSLPRLKKVVVAADKVIINVTWPHQEENEEAKDLLQRVPKRHANSDMTWGRQCGKKNEVATAHQPTKNASCLTPPSSSGEIFAEESHLTDPAFWASINVMVADHESTPVDAKCGHTSCVNGSQDATNSGVDTLHVMVHNKLDTPASAQRPLVPKFGRYDVQLGTSSGAREPFKRPRVSANEQAQESAKAAAEDRVSAEAVAAAVTAYPVSDERMEQKQREREEHDLREQAGGHARREEAWKEQEQKEQEQEREARREEERKEQEERTGQQQQPVKREKERRVEERERQEEEEDQRRLHHEEQLRMWKVEVEETHLLIAQRWEKYYIKKNANEKKLEEKQRSQDAQLPRGRGPKRAATPPPKRRRAAWEFCG
jgi:hypothetical protein